MSDGTTGIQVAPIPTESEMASIRQIFTNVANALVRASELATQVTDLEGRLNKLDHDYTSVMARNDELVLSLNEVRLQRDQAQSDLVAVKGSLSTAQGEVSKLNSEADFTMNKINGLEEELRKVKVDYQDAVNEWDKEVIRADAAEAKLKAIHQTLGIPEPKPEPIAPKAEPQPTLHETDDGRLYERSPEPTPQPEAAIPKYEWDPNKF